MGKGPVIFQMLWTSQSKRPKNVDCNRDNYTKTVFNFVEAALGASGDEEVVIGGKKVMTPPLKS